MKKKYFALTMSLVMILSTIGLVSFADTKIADKAAEKTEIMKELRTLEKKYDVVFSENADPALKGTISLNTVSEVEAVLKELKRNGSIAPVAPTGVQNLAPSLMATAVATNYNAADTMTWWAPFSGWGMTGLASWRNISFNYTYYMYGTSNKRFITNGVTGISSDISGLNFCSWTQTSGSAPVWDGAAFANFTIKGYYQLGISIKGFTLGARINDTWTKTYTLN